MSPAIKRKCALNKVPSADQYTKIIILLCHVVIPISSLVVIIQGVFLAYFLHIPLLCALLGLIGDRSGYRCRTRRHPSFNVTPKE